MTCPVCGKAQSARYRPFCSRRCADVDLARWLRGSYAIQTDETPENDRISDQDRGSDPA
ncbi:DNA gyrase inhibitor YacG [Tropicimonas sp. IMCC6043]|uniref:DNA gyrase inhibitor YacG n=1 Tax=Tropicimonas sp. IMCC6043 TaxID=2510645 RepID=UPI00101D9290|nr:DNA gyrase inhibitor YacG [Tropicimonas sp. IMCC6043]RYH08037.1 DNA gyrase inhibitor YacG [Tropicimonas sp. IMCC6043]